MRNYAFHPFANVCLYLAKFGNNLSFGIQIKHVECHKFNAKFQFVEMDELRGGEWQEVSR
jgi:hypothetical protein